MEYLYRLFDDGEGLLYTGITDDWTRRLREHWRTKPWAPDVLSVKLETYPDRASVAAAELRAIRSEGPRYNIQHNHTPWNDPSPGRTWTAEEVITVTILVIAAGYLLYKLTEAGVSRYREWKTDRHDYLRWKLERAQLSESDSQLDDGLPSGTRQETAENTASEPPRTWPSPYSPIIPVRAPVDTPPTLSEVRPPTTWVGALATALVAAYMTPGTLLPANNALSLFHPWISRA